MKRTSSDRIVQKSLRAKHDALLLHLQTPKVRKGMEAAFNASPDELGRAAARIKRKSY